MQVRINQAKVFPLDTEALNDRINRLGLKRQFLASALQVSEMTVNRWVNGKTRNIRTVHLKALADILNCEPSDLVRLKACGSPTTVLQRHILKLLIEDEKFSKLAVEEEYDLLEANLEISFNTQFDGRLRYEIFYHLAVCNYKRERPQRAIEWLDEMLSEASTIQDETLLFKAEQLRAAMYCLQGKFRLAERGFERLLRDLDPHMDGGLQYLIFSNFGYLKFCQSDYTRAWDLLQSALDCLDGEDTSIKTRLNLCATYRLLTEIAVIHADLGNVQEFLAKLRGLVQQIAHRYTEYRIQLFDCDMSRLQGDIPGALMILAKVRQRYPEFLDEYYLYRAVRLSCELDQFDCIDQPLQLVKQRCHYRDLWHEKALKIVSEYRSAQAPAERLSPMS